jgi:photosystem II stability/assembly factor-like uncharacterized protein
LTHRTLLTIVGFTLLGFVAGCSSPLNDGTEPTATADLRQPTATATVVAVPSETPTGTESNAQPQPSPERKTPTATEPASISTRTGATAAPTPTDEPLPTSGAELRIAGEAVSKIVPGDDSNRTMFAQAGSKLWRTNDGGRTWSEAGDGDVGPVIVALNEQNVLYSGDRGGCGRGFSFHEFRRSTDAGRTWETIADNIDIEPFLAYVVPNAAYVYGSNCGLSVSTDGGTTWDLIPDLNGEEIFGIATNRDDPMAQVIVVAATEGGTGRLFLLDTTDPARPLFIGALTQYWGDAAIDWADGRIVIAHAHMVGVSDDGGETWLWSRDGLKDATFSVNPLFEPIPEEEMNPFRRFEVVRIDPADRDRIWIGGTHGAFLSDDGGETWTRIGDNVEVTGIAISTLTNRVLISSASGTRLWDRNGT